MEPIAGHKRSRWDASDGLREHDQSQQHGGDARAPPRFDAPTDRIEFDHGERRPPPPAGRHTFDRRDDDWGGGRSSGGGGGGGGRPSWDRHDNAGRHPDRDREGGDWRGVRDPRNRHVGSGGGGGARFDERERRSSPPHDERGGGGGGGPRGRAYEPRGDRGNMPPPPPRGRPGASPDASNSIPSASRRPSTTRAPQALARPTRRRRALRSRRHSRGRSS